jgi:hypothetical protein
MLQPCGLGAACNCCACSNARKSRPAAMSWGLCRGSGGGGGSAPGNATACCCCAAPLPPPCSSCCAAVGVGRCPCAKPAAGRVGPPPGCRTAACASTMPALAAAAAAGLRDLSGCSCGDSNVAHCTALHVSMARLRCAACVDRALRCVACVGRALHCTACVALGDAQHASAARCFTLHASVARCAALHASAARRATLHAGSWLCLPRADSRAAGRAAHAAASPPGRRAHCGGGGRGGG